jgi:hypothetical protein
MHANDIAARGTEVDEPFLDELLGCHFVSRSAAERRLAGMRDPTLVAEAANGLFRVESLYAQAFDREPPIGGGNGPPVDALPALAEASLLPLG